MASRYSLMREEEIEQASTYEFGNFFKGVRGARRKKRLFAALEHAQDGLEEIKIHRWDGDALAGIAAGYLRKLGAIRFFLDRKVADLGTSNDRRQFLELLGRYAAEKYLREKKHFPESDPSLMAVTVSTEELKALMAEAIGAGDAADEVTADLAEEDVTIDDAVQVLADVLGRYESAIPAVGEDGMVPKRIQDVGIAKAAFLGLRAQDLRSIAGEEDDDESEQSTKEVLANRLAQEYAGKEDEIARIVLDEQKRADSVHGLVTRLIPLKDAPTNLAGIAERLERLDGRFFETRPAEWFCFRKIERTANGLIITGEVLGYQVRVSEVKEEARLQPQPHRDRVKIRLRDGVPWADTDARRAGSLVAIRRALAQTELADPRPVLAPPAAVVGEPFSRCDPRTLWMLELLYRELSADPFSVSDHLMVNFERPQTGSGPGDVRDRRPTVNAVRLKGMLLIDHPEVCDLILRGRRIVEVDLALRVKVEGTDARMSPTMRVRLGWANDHLTIISGELGESFNPGVHASLVDDVRAAAAREIDKSRIELPLQRIQTNAGQSESDELGSVLGATDDAQTA